MVERELIPKICPLTSTGMQWHVPTDGDDDDEDDDEEEEEIPGKLTQNPNKM